MTARKASHAGSWYTSSQSKLSSDLSKWLQAAHTSGAEGAVDIPIQGCKAVIAPHAGYSYSGPAAAWAYKTINPSKFTRIFVLGPSHHFYLDGCALSKCESYDTPVGSLPLDLDTIKELKTTKKFESMNLRTDEDEHSIEMHLPYIRHVFKDRDIKIVPILIGAISASKEREFGKVLAPYLDDPQTFFVVSSDFCHWGTRFNYTYYRDPSSSASATNLNSRSSAPSPPIHASIRALDHRGIDAISFPPPATPSSESHKTARDAHDAFTAYLAETKNTVCGRHPIGVLLGAIAQLQSSAASHHSPTSPGATAVASAAGAVPSAGVPTVSAAADAVQHQEGSRVRGWKGAEVRFVRYEQSSQCVEPTDSSVSYASAYLRVL